VGAEDIVSESTNVCVGYITAWRWWGVAETTLIPSGNRYIRDFLPRSTAWENHWKWSGENIARNLHDILYDVRECSQTEITPENQLGFYAFKDNGIEHVDSDAVLFGRVALYGDVCEHEYGYRAEKARILDVYCREDWYPKLSHIPQIKGIYKITDKPPVLSPIVDSDGNPYTYEENCKCLSLVPVKIESCGMSPSDSPTIPEPLTLTIRSCSASANLTVSMLGSSLYDQLQYLCPLISTTIGTDGKYLNSTLYAPETSLPAIIEPVGDYCSICNCRILATDAVVVAHCFPDDYQQKIIDNTFEFVKVMTHWDCETQIRCNDDNLIPLTEIDSVAFYGNHNGNYCHWYTYGYGYTYGGIMRSDNPITSIPPSDPVPGFIHGQRYNMYPDKAESKPKHSGGKKTKNWKQERMWQA
jgi:hypothetical protein